MVNNDALSTGGVVQMCLTAKNVMSAYINMSKSAYIAYNTLSIMITVSTVQYPWYDPEPHLNCYSFSPKVSVNNNYDNAIPPIFCPGFFPYGDKFMMNIFFNR